MLACKAFDATFRQIIPSTNMPSLCQTSNQSLELGTKDKKWKINASSCPELKGDIYML